MNGRKIIFLEFNELCPDLLGCWMDKGKLPNFKHFYDSSQVLTCTADETAPEYLEPWIQWYSLHTGLSYDQHKVFHLTDGTRTGSTDIWRALLDAGYSVGNCAGMNAAGFCKPGSFYLPDYWSSELPYPDELVAYQRVVSTEVAENTNAGRRLSWTAYLEFLRFLTAHGLRARSVLVILQRLFSDFVLGDISWKRPVLLDRLQADVFLYYWTMLQPDFASFFLNSVAHFQHAYLHLLKPDQFDVPSDTFDSPAHRNAVFFGYKEMDRLLADFFALENQGVMLVLATALSQQPNTHAGLYYYRPRNVKVLLRALGVQTVKLQPVMAQQFSVEFADQGAADEARIQMEAVRYDGRPVFMVDVHTPRKLFFGCQLHCRIPDDAQITFTPSVDAPLPPMRFYDVFYRISHTKSGAHNPDSILWFKTGNHAVHDERVSILDIFPTILDYYRIAMSTEAGKPRSGRSLLSQLGLSLYANPPQMKMMTKHKFIDVT